MCIHTSVHYVCMCMHYTYACVTVCLHMSLWYNNIVHDHKIHYQHTSYRVKQAVTKKDEAMKSLRTQHEVRRYIYLNDHTSRDGD